MVILCFLCNKGISRGDKISLHRFPRNPELRTKWLNACGLTANDDTSGTYLCSIHFKKEDMCQSNILGNVQTFIKRTAVPELYIKNPLNIDESNDEHLPSKTPLLEIFNENRIPNQSSSFLPDSNITQDNNVVISTRKSPEKCITLNSIEVQMPNNSNIGNDLVDFNKNDDSNQRIENRMVNSKSGSENTDGNNSPSKCRKRKFFEARNVGEISPSDFASPKRIKRIINLIKKTEQNKSKKIKQLQGQMRYLFKRVQSMQNIINRLKENRKLPDESGHARLV